MTDRELIEAAAEFAGMPPWTWDEESGCINCPVRSHLTNMHLWNPLTDDGDALRLAVKLNFLVHYIPEFERCMAEESLTDKYDSDPNAATRRAIVRAAAEIGRNNHG